MQRLLSISISMCHYRFLFCHRFVEENTDNILNNPENPSKAKHKSQEEIEETVSTRKLQ